MILYHAALAFNMEPVSTVLFAWILISQYLTVEQILGGVCIMGSLIAVSKPAQ